MYENVYVVMYTSEHDYGYEWKWSNIYTVLRIIFENQEHLYAIVNRIKYEQKNNCTAPFIANDDEIECWLVLFRNTPTTVYAQFDRHWFDRRRTNVA